MNGTVSKFKRTTARTIAGDLYRFSDLVLSFSEKERKAVADAFNDMCNELLGDDVFGTEGQLDPRGDHRE